MFDYEDITVTLLITMPDGSNMAFEKAMPEIDSAEETALLCLSDVVGKATAALQHEIELGDTVINLLGKDHD